MAKRESNKELTIKDKKKVCRYILNDTDVNGIVKPHYANWLIKNVFVKHWRWEIKKGVGIDHIEVRLCSGYNHTKEFWIVRTDGTETDISYIKCLSPNDKIKEIKKACRTAIEPEIIKVKNTVKFPFLCPILGIQINDMEQIEIDHYDLTFEELFKKWISDKDVDELYNNLLSSKKDGETITEFDDIDIINDFVDFHNKNTHLRAVSKKANQSELRKVKK